jgi:hypothetical protein
MRLKRRGRKHHNAIESHPPDVRVDGRLDGKSHQHRDGGEGGSQRRRDDNAAPGASHGEPVDRGGEQSDGAGDETEGGTDDHAECPAEKRECGTRNKEAAEVSQDRTEEDAREQNAHRRKAEASAAGLGNTLGHPSNLRGRFGASQGYLKDEGEDSDQVVLPHGRGYRHR